MSGRFETLAHLLHPITPKEFFAEYYEKKVLHVERNDPSYYGLLSLADVDTYLATQRDSRFNRIGVVPGPKSGDEGRRVSCNATPWQEFYAAYNAGESLVFDDLAIGWPPVAKLTAALGRELSGRVQMNVYCTPPGQNQGFDVHVDLHDTTILQLDGSKEWEFFTPGFELPIQQRLLPSVYKHIDRHDKPDDYGDATRTLTMRPGDLLYIPRGIPHCAHTAEHPSLHGTLGLHVPYWGNMLLHALSRTVLNDVRLRRAVPTGFFDRPERHAEMETTFRQLLRDMAENAVFAEALQEAEAQFLSQQVIAPSGHFQHLAQSKDLKGESVVALRANLACRVLVDEEHAYIYFSDNHIRAPRWVEPALRFIQDAREPFRIDDLPQPLSANSRLILARRLVREGLLTINSL